MTRYACTQPGCPRRPAVTADTAPNCYTCGGAMAEVTPPRLSMEFTYEEPEYFDYTRSVEYRHLTSEGFGMLSDRGRSDDDEISFRECPRVPVPHPAPDIAEALRRHGIESATTAEPVPYTRVPVSRSLDGLTVTGNDGPMREEAWPIIGFECPEPKPEQRASRTLPPMTINVMPSEPIEDLEALRRELQAEILRALSEPDPCPYVGTGEQALVRAIERAGGTLIDPETPPTGDLDALCAKYGHLPVADALDAIERDARQMGIETDRDAIWRAATERNRLDLDAPIQPPSTAPPKAP